jgi:type I restriction enzyme S subunit
VKETDLPFYFKDGNIVWLRKFSKEINSTYLFYWLNSEYGRRKVLDTAIGSTQAALTITGLGAISISCPSLAQQTGIVRILSAIDQKITMNSALSKTLEDIAQTIFKSWFIDFDPVAAKMAEEKPKGMDAATAALFPDSMEESELGLIPKGWEVNGIGDFGKVVTGKTPPTKVPEYWGYQIPFVTIPDMHGQILITSTVRALSQEGADSQRNQNVSAGSTMVTCIATPGLVGYATKLCQTNQQINSVVPGDEYSSVWLFWHLRGLIPTLIRNSGIGTVFANLNKSDFSKIKSVTPTRAVRDAFSGMVQPMMELLETLNYESQCLRDIRDGILPRLIAGELKIPDEMLAS